jgi:hypothetical protein
MDAHFRKNLTSLTITLLPNDPIDGDLYQICIRSDNWGSFDRSSTERLWAIRHHIQWCLNGAGEWDVTDIPANEAPDWIEDHGSGLLAALRLAADAGAPGVTITHVIPTDTAIFEQQEREERNLELQFKIDNLEHERDRLAEELTGTYAEIERLRKRVRRLEGKSLWQLPVEPMVVGTEWAIGKRTSDGSFTEIWSTSEPESGFLAPGRVILRREVGPWRVADDRSGGTA